jgi:hypothetical protein
VVPTSSAWSRSISPVITGSSSSSWSSPAAFAAAASCGLPAGSASAYSRRDRRHAVCFAVSRELESHAHNQLHLRAAGWVG